MNGWLYDEFKHCGVDYSDAECARDYDSEHEKFRDYEKEFLGMLDFLSLQDEQNLTMIDLGCGTGANAIYAAKKFKKVYAVDISSAMLNEAKTKAFKEGTTNVEFINSGFLTYCHEGEPADLLVTKIAFHHLPDFWKQIALLNMNGMLKKEGILYIFDVVFNFEATDYKTKISDWLGSFNLEAGSKFKEEFETHIKDEYSTFSWILEGMIERAGFSIEKSRTSLGGFIAEYFCRKTSDVSKLGN